MVIWIRINYADIIIVGYEHTHLVLKMDHKIQHKFDNLGKNNKIREFNILYK